MKAIKTLILGLCLAGQFVSQAQKLVTPESYLILLYYNEKTDVSYNVSSVQTNSKGTASGSTYTMHFHVLSFTDTSAVMTIKYSNIKPVGEKVPGFDEMARTTEKLTLKVSLDQAGSYTGLLNYDECKAEYDKMLAAAKKAGKQDTATMKAWELLQPVFADPAVFEYSMLEDFFYLAFPYGVEVNRKKPVKADYEMGNLLGGQPYPAKMTISAGPYVPNKTLQVNTSIVLDKVAGKTILKESLASLLGIAEINEVQWSKFNITDSYTHVLDADNGWPESITYKRSVQIENGKTSKTVSFKIIR